MTGPIRDGTRPAGEEDDVEHFPVRPAPRQAPGSGPAGRPALTLYQRPGVLVTREVFEAGGRRYRVADLRRLRTARGRQNPVAVRAAVLAGAVLAAVGVGFTVGRDPVGPSRDTYLILAVSALLPLVAWLVARRQARRAQQLWGEYLGGTVLLFATVDEREFGQVTRALQRAREAVRR
jgi:hypothetical protein